MPRLGRFLGVANSFSNILTFHILPKSGIVIQAGTVQRVTEPEKQTDSVQERMKEYSNKIADKFKEGRLQGDSNVKPDLEEWSDLLESDPDFAEEFNCIYDNSDVKEADDDFNPDTFYNFIGMCISVDRGDVHPTYARVTKRLKDHCGNPIGKKHELLCLDTLALSFLCEL